MVTALATHLRPQAYTGKTYKAFRVTESNRTHPHRIVGTPATLDEALNAALTGPSSLYHKDKLVIRESEAGKVTLHVFAIKRKSKPDYVREGFETRRVQRLYAEPVCSIDGEILG
jgi:hypothetical protein